MQIQGIQSSKATTSIFARSVFYYDPTNPNSYKSLISDPVPVDNDPISFFKENYGKAAFTLTQASPTHQPLFKYNNGQPVLNFVGDGAADGDVLLTGILNPADYFPHQNFTLFMVAKANTNASNLVALKFSGGNAAARVMGVSFANNKIQVISSNFIQSTSDYDTFKLMSCTRTAGATGLNLYTNGVLEAVASAGAISGFPSNDSLHIGAFRNAVPYGGAAADIGVVIAFEGVLSDADRIYIEQHLIKKYNL